MRTDMKKVNEFPGIRNLNEKVAILMFLLLLLLFSGVRDAFAQGKPDSLLVEIETKDGNKYTGLVIEESESRIVLVTESLGKLVFPKASVRRVRRLEKAKMRIDGYWADNPQATRNFWSPTGYGLKAGEAYYQNVWVMFNQ